jgi:hypothetical protein
MATMTSDASAAALLGRFRGRVTKARLTYPERAALDVTDHDGGHWYLATWDAEYLPGDPEVLHGKTVVGADLDEKSQVLTVDFSDGTAFSATPIAYDDEDVENWELFTPEGMVLTYGPRGRWRLGRAGDPC